MSKNNFYKIICFPLLLFAVSIAGAQRKTEVKASIDRNRILIGEAIQLKLEADIPENESIRFFSIDTINHFEILQKTKTDTSITNTGTLLIRVIPITSFDSGHWVIPSFVVAEDLRTDSISVDVGFTPFDPAQDYHDIKDIIEISHGKGKGKQGWWYAAAGFLLLILLIYLLLKRKQYPALASPYIIDPYEEALKQLDKLRNEKPEAKQYYSQLTDIFRLYVFRKKGIHSLQKTTNDLVIQLKSIVPGKEQFDQLSQILRMSDFVKFAKYQPEKMEDVIAFKAITESIMNIEKTESNSSS